MRWVAKGDQHHNGVQISQAARGNKNWFEKLESNYREVLTKGNENWFKKPGVVRNRKLDLEIRIL